MNERMLPLGSIRINTHGPRRLGTDQFFGSPLPTRAGADAKTYELHTRNDINKAFTYLQHNTKRICARIVISITSPVFNDGEDESEQRLQPPQPVADARPPP